MFINQVSALAFSLTAAIFSAGIEAALPKVHKENEKKTKLHKCTTNYSPIILNAEDSSKEQLSSEAGTRHIAKATVMKQVAKKITAAKDFIKNKFVGSTSDGSDDDNSCWEDYNSLTLRNLPMTSEEDIAQTCVFDSKFDLIYTASNHCDFIQSYFYSNFGSAREIDSQCHMVPVEFYTFPGEGNFYVTDDMGVAYEVFSIYEKNVPICFPRSCNYTETISNVNGFETHSEDVSGYQNSEYYVPSNYNALVKTSAESYGTVPRGIVMNFWVMIQISIIGIFWFASFF